MKGRLGAALAFALAALSGCRGAGEALKAVEACKRLELGMSEQQVYAIMGAPVQERLETPGRGTVKGEADRRVLVYRGHPSFSVAPSVHIDSAKGQATYISCTEDYWKSSASSSARP